MRICLVLLFAVALASCSQDPMDRPGTWSIPPAGLDSNNVNLRAMLVNPNDLTAGAGEESSLGAIAAPPVQALETGRRRPLPSVNAAPIAVAPSTAANAGGGVSGAQQ